MSFSQVQTFERVRQDNIAELPSLTFSVTTPASGNVKFTHVVGLHPREEASGFCELHYPAAPLDACINSMLETMQMAYEEGLQKL